MDTASACITDNVINQLEICEKEILLMLAGTNFFQEQFPTNIFMYALIWFKFYDNVILDRVSAALLIM